MSTDPPTVQRENFFASSHRGHAPYDDPALGAVVVPLQRDCRAGVHHEPLHLEARSAVHDREGAPRAMYVRIRLLLRSTRLSQRLHNLPDLLRPDRASPREPRPLSPPRRCPPIQCPPATAVATPGGSSWCPEGIHRPGCYFRRRPCCPSPILPTTRPRPTSRRPTGSQRTMAGPAMPRPRLPSPRSQSTPWGMKPNGRRQAARTSRRVVRPPSPVHMLRRCPAGCARVRPATSSRA